ncbi:MAG: SURF1 family protein [Chitinophagaceae bacterium]|nr:SURF1 family protein [Polaromonas sp.]
MLLTSQRLRFWCVTAAAVLVTTGTAALGLWQLGRADQKLALQSAIQTQAGQSLLNAQTLAALPNKLDAVHRPASLTGVWLPEHTVFLDNRSMLGKTGFTVVTPLVLDGSGQVIVVQRGWVMRDFSNRTNLPNVTTPPGRVTIRGRIAPPPSKLYAFKGADEGRIRQNIDIQDFSREIGLVLLAGMSVLQLDPASDGLLRDWARPNVGVEKHYGYAFQWFALCALVLGLYIWFQLIRPLRNTPRDATSS